MKHPIYPCLWFDGQAKEAATFYCSIFKDAKILTDTPLVVNFEIKGQKFMGLNGGPNFKFNEAISFVIDCDTQGEIDYYWDKLTSDGGQESVCGWCKDKYGISWQIVPAILSQLMTDPAKAQRVIKAIMPMKKLDMQTMINA